MRAGLKPHSSQEDRQKSRSLSVEAAMLNVTDHARSFMPAHVIAPGGLKKRGQLGTSIAEQSKARSVPLQVMPASSNAAAKLPVLPCVFPPTGTAAQNWKL